MSEKDSITGCWFAVCMTAMVFVVYYGANHIMSYYVPQFDGSVYTDPVPTTTHRFYNNFIPVVKYVGMVVFGFTALLSWLNLAIESSKGKTIEW